MASWKLNTIMEWSIDNGTTWIKVTDHGRSELSADIEDIGTKQRMVNGTMRKYTVAKKRTFSWSYENLPDKQVSFLANGTTWGNWLEAFYNRTDGAFLMRLRSGSDINTTNVVRNGNEDSFDNDRVFTVMFSEFSKTVVKRGKNFDLWNVNIAVEEV
jgi:hypothetical protein